MASSTHCITASLHPSPHLDVEVVAKLLDLRILRAVTGLWLGLTGTDRVPKWSTLAQSTEQQKMLEVGDIITTYHQICGSKLRFSADSQTQTVQLTRSNVVVQES